MVRFSFGDRHVVSVGGKCEPGQMDEYHYHRRQPNGELFDLSWPQLTNNNGVDPCSGSSKIRKLC